MDARRSVLLAALVATSGLLGPAGQAAEPLAEPDAGPDVINEWTVIAERTIFTEGLLPPASGSLYAGFVSIAMYDAVVSIRGGYEPYAYHERPYADARADVAAATAARRVLRRYFPASTDALNADYDAFMADVPRGADTKHGRAVGKAAAIALVHARASDGRNADVTLDVEPAPGVWRPTEPSFAPMTAPWLGFVEPLALAVPTQIELPGPDPLGSAAYAEDFAEVHDYGSLEGSLRNEEQDAIAAFYNFNPVVMYQEALRDAVARRGWGLVQRARAFALLGTANADAFVACWREKFDEPFWRPITAIHLADTDGNAATEADQDWVPLLPTPPYPDYPSGHAALTGATSNTLGHLLGEDSLDIDIFSPASGTTRHYERTAVLDEDTMNARIWQGIHFRRAMTDGNALGHDVSDWTIAHYFRPVD